MFQRSGWSNRSKVSVKDVSQIRAPMEEIKEPNNPRFPQNIYNILLFYFGKHDTPGTLAKFTADYSNYRPTQWISEMEKLLDTIDPKSPIFQKIYHHRDTRINLNNSYLPSYIDSSSVQRFNRKLEMKSNYKNFSIPIFDAYFLMLAKAIYDTPSHIPETTQYEYLMIDDTFNSLSRNCLLVLLRRHLEYFASMNRKTEFLKILSAIRIYFVDQLVNKFDKERPNRTSNRNSQHMMNSFDNTAYNILQQAQQFFTKSLNYKLKAHHIHVLMLVLRYPDFATDYLSDFYKYFLGIISNYKSLYADRFCLASLIRLWIFSLINKTSNVESKVMSILVKASSQEGCFYLQRYKASDIINREQMNPNNITIAYQLLKLFSNQNYWIPNTAYIFTIACFFNLLHSSQIFFVEAQRSSGGYKEKNQQLKLVKKILERINNSLIDIFCKIKSTDEMSIKNARDVVIDNLDIILQYFQAMERQANKSQNHHGPNFVGSNFQRNQHFSTFRFKDIDLNIIDKRSRSKNDIVSDDKSLGFDLRRGSSSQSRRDMISFYRREHRGCWEIPIQYNQSLLLYYIFFTIAKIVDVFIPGQRNSPLLNIRFLANPILFAGLFALFILVYMMLWRH